MLFLCPFGKAFRLFRLVHSCFVSGVLSRFILASLCSFVKARSGELVLDCNPLANYGQVRKPARATRHAFGNTFRQVGRACRQVGKGKTKHPAPVKPCDHYAVFFRPCAFQGKNKHPLPAARLRDRPQRREFSGLHLGLNWKTGDAIPITADGRADKKTKRAVPPREKNDAFLWSTQAGKACEPSRVLHSFIIPQKPPGRPLLLLLLGIDDHQRAAFIHQ